MKLYIGTFIFFHTLFLTGCQPHPTQDPTRLFKMNSVILHQFNRPQPFEDFIAHVQLNNVQAIQRTLLQKANFATQRVALWNGDDDVVYPIHLAKSSLCANALRGYGAKINTQSKLGLTPLHYACLGDNIEYVEYLLNEGADPNIMEDRNCDSVLHYTLKNNTKTAHEIIPLLLQYNASLYQCDSEGRTALDLAIASGNDKIAKSFETKGIMIFFKKQQTLSLNPYEEVLQNNPTKALLDYHPHELLQNRAEGFKQVLAGKLNNQNISSDNRFEIENRVARFIMFIRQCDEKRNTQYYDYPSSQGIIINEYGCCFKETTFADLGTLVGERSVRYVLRYFNKLCRKAAIAIHRQDKRPFRNLIRKYPFILNYNQDTKTLFRYMIFNLENDIETAYSMLQCLDDINGSIDQNNNTLLHLAAIANNTKILPIIFALKKQKIESDIRNNNNETPLYIAQSLKHTQWIQELHRQTQLHAPRE